MNAVSVPPKERYSPDWMLTNYDRETTLEPDLDTELKRLTVLRTFPVLRTNTETDADYEMLAELAMSLLEAPMACIKLVDLSRIRVVASAGSWPQHLDEIPRKVSFCAHTIQSKSGILVINDTLQDERFRDMAHVKGEPHMRFYAGAALVSAEGAKIGSVCVIDTKPRPDGLTHQQYEHLAELAKLVVDMMELSRKEQSESGEQCTSFAKRGRSHSLNHCQSAQSCSPDSPKAMSSSRTIRHQSDGNLTSRSFHSSEPIVLSTFFRGIKIAMASFPKHAEVQYFMDPSCPVEFRVSNDLAVFRSAVALLTSACERTESGFVRLTVCTTGKGHIAFICEDTGPTIDQSINIFEPMPENVNIESPGCVRLDPQTGEVMSGTVCMPPLDAGAYGYSVHAVSEYMVELGGRCGFEPRNAADGTTGSIVWFSFPIEDVFIEDS
jgi:hypothetical protein